MPAPRITLLTKPGCHLCDDARAVLASVLAEPEFSVSATDLEFDEKSIVDDAALADEYAEEIPVVLLDGRVHTMWRIEPDRLRSALRASLGKDVTP